MLTKLKNYINTKLSNTVFGEASAGVKYLYERNIPLLTAELIIGYVISILITGWLLLFFENIGPHHYAMNLRNILAIWIRSGILLSLILFIIEQIMVFKFIILFTTKYRRDEEGNYNVSSEGTYGTAGKMTEAEIKEAFILEPIETIKATIFGKNPYNLKEMVGQRGKDFRKVNRNVFMVAGPSAGKSATFVINLLFQIMRRGESAIVSDPKGELYKICGGLAKLLGYEVRILNLNPMFLRNSDPCNYLMYVGDDVDKAQVVANAIIANTTGGAQMFDFWNEGALNLLQAVILRINVGTDFPESQKNLPYLFTYLTQNTLDEMVEDFDQLSPEHPAYAPYRIFADGDDKPKKQVLQGLRIKLKLFNSKNLRRILSETKGGIDILNPGRKKCLYFVGKNDQDSSMDSMISLFFTLLYQELVRYADARMEQCLPIPVHMVLDEYANMATIPDFEKKLSTVRSRDIITYIICQDINQLKTKHPMDSHKTVLNDCDYYMMLKTNDPDTMEWWCEMAGKITTNVKNVRYERSKLDILGIHAKEQVTEGQGERDVYTKDEVRKLKNDEVLVLVTQRNIAKLKTFFWKEHPYGKYLEAHQELYVLPSQHYPLWKLIEDGIVDEDFDYDDPNGPTYIMEQPDEEEVEIDKDYDPDKVIGIKNTIISPLQILKNKSSRVLKKPKQQTDKPKQDVKQESQEESKAPAKKITVTPKKQTESTEYSTNQAIKEDKGGDKGEDKEKDKDKPKGKSKGKPKEAPPPPPSQPENEPKEPEPKEPKEPEPKEPKEPDGKEADKDKPQDNKPNEQDPSGEQTGDTRNKKDTEDTDTEDTEKTAQKPLVLDDFEQDDFYQDDMIDINEFR